MNKKIFSVFAVVCLLTLAANIFVTYSLITNLFRSLIERRIEIYKIYQYESYLSHLKDAETSQRGYVITGNPSYLKPYDSSLIYFTSPAVEDFLFKEANNPISAEKISQIIRLKEKKFQELEKVIQVRKESGFEEARQLVDSNTGKALMDEERGLINAIIQDKEENINVLDTNIQNSMRKAINYLMISNTLGGIFIGLCLFSIYRSTKKIEKKEHELNENLAVKEAILNSADYAIISVDPEGVVTSFNPAAERLLGYKKEEVVNRYAPPFFHDKKEMEDRAVALSAQYKTKVPPGFEVFTFLAKQGLPDIHEWTYIRKDGFQIPVQVSITAIKDKSNHIMGYLGIANDISEQKKISRMKNELIAITSHELRSPVVAIKGSFDLLTQDELGMPENAKKVLAIGQKNCTRLLRLTDDILDIQKIEAGEVEFNFKKINVAAFLSQVILTNTFIAQKFKIDLICRRIPHELAVEADEDRLMQVLNNLISNAINYSSKGSHIEIGAEKIDSKVRFEVKDFGKGIAAEFQSKIFQKFARDISPVHAEKNGTGLGLSIAKTIIDKHQGLINFQSSPQGTVFWFELPVLN